jgi:integrase
MALVRLRYVHEVHRGGKVYRYFRRPRHPSLPLPGTPGSAEFNQAYQAALSGEPAAIGATRSKPGTINALVAEYLASLDFRQLADNTKRMRANILERFRLEHGEKQVSTLRREHVERMVASKPTPATALHFLLVLRVLMRFAVKVRLRPDEPTAGVCLPPYRSDGFYSWTDADIEAFEARHPIGSRARLAMALGLYLGQRRIDVIRLGWQHIRPGGIIEVRQQKTSSLLLIPIHPHLKTVLDVTPRNNLTFLVTRFGGPFDPMSFSAWFKSECDKAGLPKAATFHGLRKAAARRLAEAGCSEKEIAAITGHRTLKEVARYTAAADQLRLAQRGIKALIGKGTRARDEPG